MRILALLLLIHISSLTAFGQSKLDEAKQDLQSLKNGMLLVRLQTNDRKIEALKELGREEEAEQAALEQYQANKEAVLAFSQVFTFCPVYFFYADHSDQIMQGDLSSLFNHQMEAVTDPATLPKNYFTGEFGETERLNIEGFVIMDSDFVPLEAPFPHFQRKYVFMGLVPLSKGKIVERLQSRLQTTYEMWFGTDK